LRRLVKSAALANAPKFAVDLVGGEFAPISSRASQNAAALLFDLGAVDVR